VKIMVDKKTFAIGVLTLSAVMLIIANLLPTRSASATYETEHDTDYLVQTAVSPRGGDNVFVTDKRTGKMAVIMFNPARKTLELQDVQPIQAPFAKALLMKKP
jgi:hypothetical protein